MQHHGGVAGVGSLGCSSQKKSLRPDEQNRSDIQQARATWRKRIELIDPRRLIFIDESGAKTNMTRLYGRSFDGGRIVDNVPSGRWHTTTMVGAVGLDGPRSPFVFEGAMDGEAFITYVKYVLAPELKEDHVVVMDNLSSHKNSVARELIEKTGATICDQPAYSPDFNPIEQMWSKIKTFLRKAKARTIEALYQAIADAWASITKDNCLGWFKHCGYDIS